MALDPKYITTSDLEEYLVDKTTGLPLSGGIVTFYRDVNRDELKPVYALSGSPPDYSYVELPNPCILSGVGTFQDDDGNNIVAYYYPYDADGAVDRYYIEVQSSTEIPQFTRMAWPNIVVSANNINAQSDTNLVRNAQFTRWGNNTYLKSSDNVVFTQLATDDVIADDFSFKRSNENCTVKVSQINFTRGQEVVPGNPISYLKYECTSIGSGGETFKYIGQKYQSAQFMSGQEVTVALYGFSTIGEAISVYITQNFGTGGSPSTAVTTQVLAANLEDSWTQFFATITVPSVAGKTFGTNGDDYVELCIGLPLNSISNLGICNVQMCRTAILPGFPLVSVDDQLKQMDSVVNQGVFTTGDYVLSIADSKGPGWIQCNDGTIGSSFSNANYTSNELFNLYKFIWTNIPEKYAYSFNNDADPVSRGATYLEDWNANVNISLTRVLGRALGATCPTPATDEASSLRFTADASTNILTLPANDAFYTGGKIEFRQYGTLPAPLIPENDYYAIVISETEMKVATTVANALAGTAIDLTTNGSGINDVHNLLVTYDNGEFVGERTHAMSIPELPAHHHDFPVFDTTGSDYSIVDSPSTTNNFSTTDTGGNTPHNNLPPTIYSFCYFKL